MLCAGHFQGLLNGSERALQEAFPDAFGELYTQNARAFRDLYAELRLYYRGASLHLEEALAEFWARLLERLFRQLHPQLLLPDDYLDCLGKQAEALRPFGESPRELRLRATRAFVAARSFVQGLGVASDVVRKVAQVHTAGCLGPAPSALCPPRRGPGSCCLNRLMHVHGHELHPGLRTVASHLLPSPVLGQATPQAEWEGPEAWG